MSRFVANEKIITENVGLKETDDVMLYNQETEDVHVINSTAFEIFTLLKTPYTDAEIIAEMKVRYNMQDGSIDEDIRELLSDFVQKNIIIES